MADVPSVSLNSTKAAKVSVEFIPQDLAYAIINAIHERHGGVIDAYVDLMHGELSEHIYAAAILLVGMYLESKPHRSYIGWQALSSAKLKRLFCSKPEPYALFRSGQILESKAEYSKKNGICMGARLYPEERATIAEVFESYPANLSDAVLVNHKGEPYKSNHVGRTPYGKNKPLKISNLPDFTPINGEAIRVAIKHILVGGHTKPHPLDLQPRLTLELEAKRDEYQRKNKDNAQTEFESYLQRVVGHLEYLLLFAATGVPHTLKMSQSGRLYGAILHNLPRVVRKVALHGFTSFDFDACHHRIFQARASELDIPTPVLNEYLLDKAGTRAQIADEIDVTVDQAKQALIAVAYGARLRRKSYDRESALVTILGTDAYERAENHPVFSGLITEMRNVGAHWVNSALRRKNKKTERVYQINYRGLPLPVTGDDGEAVKLSSRVAHLVQGVESAMLKTAVAAHANKKTNGSNVVLTLHDGWICRLPCDESTAADAVQKRLGICVPVNSELYDLIDL